MFNFDLSRILLTIPGILIGLSFHEFGHAFVSDRLGDPTPRAQGRLTLSPLPHIDIMGFIMIMLLGFGWAKPVQINSKYFKKPRRDDILVSIAGPAMNLLLAFIFAVLVKITISVGLFTNMSINLYNIISDLFIYTIQINLVLCIFNLIPLPPLDGFHVLSNIIPFKNYNIIYKLQQYSTIILILIIVTPVVSYIIRPPMKFIFNGMMTLLGLPYYFP